MSKRVGFHLPSWMIGGSLVLVVIATLVYFYTESSDKEDEAAPSTTSSATDDTGEESGEAESDKEEPAKESDDGGADDAKGDDKPTDAKADKADDKSDQKTDDKAKKEKKPEEPKLDPSGNVAVFNNSGITGLAADVGARVDDAGWSVTGTDNWYGSIPETTVYYPPNLQDQAELLADELGVGRIMASVEPMQTDRLTLILTAAL